LEEVEEGPMLNLLLLAAVVVFVVLMCLEGRKLRKLLVEAWTDSAEEMRKRREAEARELNALDAIRLLRAELRCTERDDLLWCLRERLAAAVQPNYLLTLKLDGEPVAQNLKVTTPAAARRRMKVPAKRAKKVRRA
jgi:hypothetical protein